MRRKIALLIALVIAISLSISYVLWFFYSRPSGAYERTIIRNTANIEEANALAIAETSNYSDIFNLERFTAWNHNETWAYTWANFIDTQVIDYYDDRFENLKGKLGEIKPEGIKFHYEANVSTWDQIRVVYVPAPQGANIYDDAIQILGLNGSVLFENAKYTGPRWGMQFAHRNGSAYQRIVAEEIDFSLSKSYVIETILTYKEIWGPLAAFSVRVYQIIIVDQNLVPSLYCVQSRQLIS